MENYKQKIYKWNKSLFTSSDILPEYIKQKPLWLIVFGVLMFVCSVMMISESSVSFKGVFRLLAGTFFLLQSISLLWSWFLIKRRF